jgi:hypothetical protein
MNRLVMRLACGVIAVVGMFGCNDALNSIASQVALNLQGTPYYGSGYMVGLSLRWTAVAGASRYRVTHFRRDA